MMNRPCFALTVLLFALASLLLGGSASCQSHLSPSDLCGCCPLSQRELGGSGVTEFEDTGCVLGGGIVQQFHEHGTRGDEVEAVANLSFCAYSDLDYQQYDYGILKRENICSPDLHRDRLADFGVDVEADGQSVEIGELVSQPAADVVRNRPLEIASLYRTGYDEAYDRAMGVPLETACGDLAAHDGTTLGKTQGGCLMLGIVRQAAASSQALLEQIRSAENVQAFSFRNSNLQFVQLFRRTLTSDFWLQPAPPRGDGRGLSTRDIDTDLHCYRTVEKREATRHGTERLLLRRAADALDSVGAGMSAVADRLRVLANDGLATVSEPRGIELR